MFKPGDKAWHPQYGWGEVRKSQVSEYEFEFYKLDTDRIICGLHKDGKQSESDLNPIIFHREQKFDFSGPEPEIGTWGYFHNGESRVIIFGQLCYVGDIFFMPQGSGIKYTNFSPDLPPHIKDMMEGGK